MPDREDQAGASGAAAEAKKIRIASAEDLGQALEAEDMAERLTVLSAISKAPAKAAAYGLPGGQDLVGKLTGQLAASTHPLLRQALIVTLAAFDDPRVTEALRAVFTGSDDFKELSLAGQVLAGRMDAETRLTLLKGLRDRSRAQLNRAAANALAAVDPVEELKPADLVRLAVAADSKMPVPPLNDETEAAWLTELSGPWAQAAMSLLKSMGRPAAERLTAKFVRLPEEVRAWLVGFAATTGASEARRLCRQALESDSRELLLAGARAAAVLGPGEGELRPLLKELVKSEDPALRLAALRAGAEARDIRTKLAAEEDPDIRRELVFRLVEDEGRQAVEALRQCILEGDWRLRSAATDGLIKLGPAGAEAVRDLLNNDRPEIRLAAAKVVGTVEGSV